MLLSALASFAILAAGYLAGDPVVSLDERIAVGLHERLTPALTDVAIAVTTLGAFAVLAAIAAAAALYLASRNRPRDAILLVLTAAGVQVLTLMLKAAFGRERPSFDDPVATAATFSFPSGHSSGSLAVYGLLACLAWPALRSWKQRAALVAAAVGLIAAIGFSRLYLGVHYLSDVLAGWSVGFAWLIVSFAVVRMLFPRTEAAPISA